MTNRNVGFIQLKIVAGEVERNLVNLKVELEKLSPVENSLLVLPELWATGFSYDVMDTLAEQMEDLFSALQMLSSKHHVSLAGTLPERTVEGKYYNSMRIVDPSGIVGSYRKQFLFPGEEICFVPGGQQPNIINSQWGKVGGIVCFDLRFPNLSRTLCQKGADILICSAQWPELRVDHWKALLLARAIENQVFVVGCNGLGRNGDSVLGGCSMIISPDGMILKESGDTQESCVVDIDTDEMVEVRERFNTVTQKDTWIE